jgi:hypothetical protein
MEAIAAARGWVATRAYRIAEMGRSIRTRRFVRLELELSLLLFNKKERFWYTVKESTLRESGARSCSTGCFLLGSS